MFHCWTISLAYSRFFIYYSFIKDPHVLLVAVYLFIAPLLASRSHNLLVCRLLLFDAGRSTLYSTPRFLSPPISVWHGISMATRQLSYQMVEAQQAPLSKAQVNIFYDKPLRS